MFARSGSSDQSAKKNKRQSNEAWIPGVVLFIGLTVSVYLVDVALQEVGSTGQVSCTGDTYFLLEAAAGLACLVFPALYVHFSGRTLNVRAMFGTAQPLLQKPSPPQKTKTPLQHHRANPQNENWRQGPRPKAMPASSLNSPKQANSPAVAAATLARWNQTINAAAKAGEPDKAESTLLDMEKIGRASCRERV